MFVYRLSVYSLTLIISFLLFNLFIITLLHEYRFCSIYFLGLSLPTTKMTLAIKRLYFTKFQTLFLPVYMKFMNENIEEHKKE